MEFETILYEARDGVARITLNRPEKLNAISPTVQRELHDALWEADDDLSVHCVILKGAGHAFSAGYDLGAEWEQRDTTKYRGIHGYDNDVWQQEQGQRHKMALFDMHKPSIAQVHGYCLAGGTDLMTLCDIAICADDACIGFPAARDLGVLPQQMWLYHVGPQWAKRLLLTGDTITGVEAAQIGLTLKSVPADDLESEVEGLAARFAMIDPDLLSANKRVINLGLEMMGARSLQRVAAEGNARAHLTGPSVAFHHKVAGEGLRTTLRERDAKFGDGRARVDGPERHDERGYLVEE